MGSSCRSLQPRDFYRAPAPSVPAGTELKLLSPRTTSQTGLQVPLPSTHGQGMASCASGVSFALAIAPLVTSASAIAQIGTSAFGCPPAHPPAQPLALGRAALEIKQVSGLYNTFEMLTICKGDCWGRFTSTCPAQGTSALLGIRSSSADSSACGSTGSTRHSCRAGVGF